MSTKQNLSRELESKLEENESLIWYDFPKQSFQIVFEDLIIIPFLSFIIFIGIYLLIMFLNFNNHINLIVSSILFILIITSIINYRYTQKLAIQKKTIYGLTTKRVIILADNKIKYQNLTDIKEILQIEHPFNFKYGSIIFGEPENIFGSSRDHEPFEFSSLLGRHGGINFNRDSFAFDFITNTKTVYHLIESKINK